MEHLGHYKWSLLQNVLNGWSNSKVKLKHEENHRD